MRRNVQHDAEEERTLTCLGDEGELARDDEEHLLCRVVDSGLGHSCTQQRASYELTMLDEEPLQRDRSL